MIKEISYIQTECTDPYENLALEEALLDACREDECILYLWQNSRTVVIGKNQNPWAECLVDALEADEGHVARRLSGGGAVYHDTGNLNFTFLVRTPNYDLDKQLQVIIDAVNSQGIEAVRSGRNDILAEGRKFSGNAFYAHGDRSYHHGTLMVDVDTSVLSRYLTVSESKLKSKGVESVRSRVTNLKELNEDITIDSLKTALIEAFGKVYGLKPRKRERTDFSHEDLDKRAKRFASWEWLYGRKIDFQHELSGRSEAGEITLRLRVSSGVITDLLVYSDAMDHEASEKITRKLRGARYSGDVLQRAFAALGE